MNEQRKTYESNPSSCKQCGNQIPYSKYRIKRKYKNHDKNNIFCNRRCNDDYRRINDSGLGHRICKRCNKDKSTSEFYFVNKTRTRVGSYCKECHNLLTSENQKNNKARTYARQRAWKYGITTEQIQEIYEKQNGLCLICKVEKATDIDHCHTTDKVRGMLCRKCNQALGLLKDDTTVLHNAIDYLERNNRD